MQSMISLKLRNLLSLVKPFLAGHKLLFLFCLSIGLIIIITQVGRMNTSYNQSLSSPKIQGMSSKAEKFKQIQQKRQMIAALQELRMHNVLRQQHSSAKQTPVYIRDDSLTVDMHFSKLKTSSHNALHDSKQLEDSKAASLPAMYGW